MANTLLILLIIVAAIATVGALVRGVVTFLKTTEEELNSTSSGPSESSLKQNRMMMARITFQAIAVALVALLLLFHGQG